MIAIRLAQIEVEPGLPGRNAARVLQALEVAIRDGISLFVLPELCIPGYLIGDAWERPAFLQDCQTWNQRLIEATSDTQLTLVFGTVSFDSTRKGEDGRWRRYNSYIVAQDGKALVQPVLGMPYGIKTLLPNYREFDDGRYFYDLRKLALERDCAWSKLLAPWDLTIQGQNLKLGVLLCEDSWDDDYAQRPLQVLADKGTQLVLNLSASPFTICKNCIHNRWSTEKARALALPLAYVNCTGVQNNGKSFFSFDGHSTVYDATGTIVAELPAFQEASLDFQCMPSTRSVGLLSAKAISRPSTEVAQIGTALRYALPKILALFRIERVVIAVSGGIDSAVAAALYGSILPSDRLLLANLPSRYNSPTTIALAQTLATQLGAYYTSLSIEDSVALTRSQIDGLHLPAGAGRPCRQLRLEALALENVQARDRASRLQAALASAFGGAFTCNANKAEATVGYSTLYGYHGGFLAVLGDLWKHQVYALGHWLNEQVYGRGVIPSGSFSIVPSAELSTAQAVDEGKGDPLIYPYHDRLFHAWVQRWQRATPEDILCWYANQTLSQELGLDFSVDSIFPDVQAFIADLERWWELYCGMGAIKRVQSPPNLVISSRGFGFDHREHLGPAVYSQNYHVLRARLLSSKPAAMCQVTKIE